MVQVPDNMKLFWKFLRQAHLPPDSLSCMSYSTFGLGDSSYPVYNAVARRLHERLKALGATPLCNRGLGDDQHPLGYDGELQPWMEVSGSPSVWRNIASFLFPLLFFFFYLSTHCSIPVSPFVLCRFLSSLFLHC